MIGTNSFWFRLRCWWHGYDPTFVKNVLEAAAATGNVKFNSVVDLLEWLDET